MTTKDRKPRSPSPARIRVVSDGNGTIRLVRAVTDAKAIDHCVKPWTAHLASQDEILKYGVDAKIAVEDAAAQTGGDAE
jgi:hypothetical protein